jgi:hypothetical protein
MTLVHFLPCYRGSIDPYYKSTASAKRETEICLSRFGQIARRRPGPFLCRTAIKGCDKVKHNET